jgi:hypothetical protein
MVTLRNDVPSFSDNYNMDVGAEASFFGIFEECELLPK